MCVGLNDYGLKVKVKDYRTAALEFVKKLRELNGNAPFIWMWDCEKYKNTVFKIAEELGGKDAGIYVIEYPTPVKSRAANHPNIEEQKWVADKVCERIVALDLDVFK